MIETKANLKDAGFPALDTPAYEAPRKVAYIGVDGVRHRVLVPVRHIWLNRAEGPSELCVEKAFKNWHDASWQLTRNAQTAPKGGAYDKHDFIATFADGWAYHGRFDLKFEMQWPQIEAHILNYLVFIADNPRGTSLYSDEERVHARAASQTYELGQNAVPAPDDWEVIWDYRKEQRNHRDLVNEIWPEGLSSN